MISSTGAGKKWKNRRHNTFLLSIWPSHVPPPFHPPAPCPAALASCTCTPGWTSELQPRNTQRIWCRHCWCATGAKLEATWLEYLIVVNGIYSAIIQTPSNIKKNSKTRQTRTPRELVAALHDFGRPQLQPSIAPDPSSLGTAWSVSKWSGPSEDWRNWMIFKWYCSASQRCVKCKGWLVISGWTLGPFGSVEQQLHWFPVFGMPWCCFPFSFPVLLFAAIFPWFSCMCSLSSR